VVCVFGASAFSVPPGEFSVGDVPPANWLLSSVFYLYAPWPSPSFFETMVTIFLGSFIRLKEASAHECAFCSCQKLYWIREILSFKDWSYHRWFPLFSVCLALHIIYKALCLFTWIEGGAGHTLGRDGAVHWTSWSLCWRGGGRQRIEASIMGNLLRVIERCIGAWNVCNLF
jgi:hypothetical protein